MSRDASKSSGTSPSTAISLDGVSRTFDATEALEPVSISIRTGEATAVLGPSGSGKTTLLLLIAGQLKPTSGRVQVNGADLAHMRPGRELSRMVGIIPQQFDLVPNLSALQNVLAGRLGEWGLLESIVSLVRPRQPNLAMAVLDRVGIADRAFIRADRLSGGEQQRVAIARLLVQDPQVVLADEPVASLDPARAETVLELLSDLTVEGEKTLVASVHSVELARKYFTRYIGLRNGALQFDLPSHRVSDALIRDLYDPRGLRGETQDA